MFSVLTAIVLAMVCTLKSQLLNSINSHLGLKLHITDIYLEELAKVAGIALKPKRLILLLSPFFNIIKSSDQ
jgi:hypothetical protein